MKFPLGVNDFLLIMACCLLFLGLLSVVMGVFMLVVRVGGREVKTIAAQASRLAQKGIAEDVAGLVGNASTLVNALNDLARTTTGIGIFLVLIGFAMMGAAFFLVQQIH